MTTTELKILAVADNAGKIRAICDTVSHHFKQGEAILIAMQTHEAAAFVDEMLWKHPPEGFIPHRIVESPCQEAVAIAVGKKNLSKAPIVINLQTEPFTDLEAVEILYDLKDTTTEERSKQSQQRQEAYRKMLSL